MMSDRERIGKAIAAHIATNPDELTLEQSHLIEGLADAVLDALAGRLLPELPPYDVLEVMIDDAGRANVSLRHYREEPFAYGTGDTIPEALRNLTDP